MVTVVPGVHGLEDDRPGFCVFIGNHVEAVVKNGNLDRAFDFVRTIDDVVCKGVHFFEPGGTISVIRERNVLRA